MLDSKPKAGGLAVKRLADEAYEDLPVFFTEMRPAFSYQQIAEVLAMKGGYSPVEAFSTAR